MVEQDAQRISQDQGIRVYATEAAHGFYPHKGGWTRFTEATLAGL